MATSHALRRAPRVHGQRHRRPNFGPIGDSPSEQSPRILRSDAGEWQPGRRHQGHSLGYANVSQFPRWFTSRYRRGSRSGPRRSRRREDRCRRRSDDSRRCRRRRRGAVGRRRTFPARRLYRPRILNRKRADRADCCRHDWHRSHDQRAAAQWGPRPPCRSGHLSALESVDAGSVTRSSQRTRSDHRASGG